MNPVRVDAEDAMCESKRIWAMQMEDHYPIAGIGRWPLDNSTYTQVFVAFIEDNVLG